MTDSNQAGPPANPETDTPAPTDLTTLARVLEGALLAAGQPLNLQQMNGLFDEQRQPGHSLLREALALLDAELESRAVELVEVAGGYRLQIRASLMPEISRLWAEKPPRYSRALLETLAIIAYRQPITRGEIEEIRGVSLSSNILKTLQERDWIKVIGHRDIPGKPELLGTTKDFLDYFGLKGLDDLPTLAEIRDLDTLEPELALNDPEAPSSNAQIDQTESNPTRLEPQAEPIESPRRSGEGDFVEALEGDAAEAAADRTDANFETASNPAGQEQDPPTSRESDSPTG